MSPPMTHRFAYPVHDLQNAPKVIDAPLPAEWLRELLNDCEAVPFDNEPGHLEVRLTMSGRDVIVHGRVRAALGMPCGRCLKPMKLDIDTEISLMLSPGKVHPAPVAPKGKGKDAPEAEPAKSKRSARDASKGAPKVQARPEKFAGKGRWSRDGHHDVYEFAEDEADSDTYDGDEVVLDPFVREWILLETPIFPLCSEECPGIRPDPQAQCAPVEPAPVVDPRLRPLLEIQKKKL